MLLKAATSPVAKLLMFGIISIYLSTHTHTFKSNILHNKWMCQLYSQRTALRTTCCDIGLVIQSCLLLFKALFSSYMLSTVSTLSLHHCLSFSFPFLTYLLPTGYWRLTFSTLSAGYLPQRKKVKGSLQTAIRQDRNLGSYLVLVTVWIFGSLLKFVITSWALKHCPNMFCCESMEPVWHFKRERAMRHHYSFTESRNGGGLSYFSVPARAFASLKLYISTCPRPSFSFFGKSFPLHYSLFTKPHLLHSYLFKTSSEEKEHVNQRSNTRAWSQMYTSFMYGIVVLSNINPVEIQYW